MNASKELVRVGEVAERLGVSPRTIKYYEELGLVRPETRSQGGFRLYGEEDIRRLERVLRMKGIGYSLAAIRELLAVRDAAQEADKVTVLRTAVERLKDREREVATRIRQTREDLKRAEALREELQHDIALCKSRLQKLKE
ncbi:MAG TPA: MerR family transcriptional regulator [Rubrobacteraceae bacterium]|nr:MerR family transcriptional regulator [Rubrobacteraceae bacterium]